MGIVHFEDQPIDDFLDSVGNLNRLIALEKLDGANMQIGVDSEGRLFTSREQKGNIEDRYYEAEQWGNEPWAVGFRSAHMALDKVRGTFLKNLSPNDIIDCEVIYGPQPNAIRYSDTHNYVIMLRPYAGEPNINRLKDVLEEKDIHISVPNVVYTDDGIDFKYKTESQIWQFGQTPRVPNDKIQEILDNEKIKENLIALGEYLKQRSTIVTPLGGEVSNAKILSVKLNARPMDVPAGDWANLKKDIKAEKEIVTNKVTQFKLVIKAVMVEKLLRRIGSKFGPSPEEGGWIEGVVFIDPENSRMFKVVDKDKFTKLNKFNWTIRSEIQDRIVKPSYEKVAIAIGHAPLGRQQTRKLYISQNGDTPEQAIRNIASTLDESKAREVIKIIEKAQIHLKRYVEVYNQRKGNLKIKDNDGKEYTYDKTIDNRTLSYFAEINKSFSKMIYFLESKNYKNFIAALAKTSLDDES